MIPVSLLLAVPPPPDCIQLLPDCLRELAPGAPALPAASLRHRVHPFTRTGTIERELVFGLRVPGDELLDQLPRAVPQGLLDGTGGGGVSFRTSELVLVPHYVS